LPAEEKEGRPPSGFHPDQPFILPVKLIHCPDQAPIPDRDVQTPEMHSHFVNLLNCAVSNLNKNPHSYHTHPYFGAKLQKAISVWVLYDYDTVADISCISNCTFNSLPLD
jgi:hypothetical protein